MKKIIAHIKENNISIEIINYLKQLYKCNVYTKEELDGILNLINLKIKNSIPEMPNNFKEILTENIKYGSLNEIKDFIMIDGAIFIEEYSNLEINTTTTFIGSEEDIYKLRHAFDFIQEFPSICKDKDKRDRFAKEFNEIFKNQYGYEYLPKNLELTSMKGVETIKVIESPYILADCSVKELAESYTKGQTKKFKIIARDKITGNYKAVTIILSNNKEKTLELIDSNNNFIRLNEVLEKEKNNNRPKIKIISKYKNWKNNLIPNT